MHPETPPVRCSCARPAASGVRGCVHASFAAGPRGVRVDARSTAPLELRGPFGGHTLPRFFLRNVSAGAFAGDRYDVALAASEGARLHVEPTAATKVYTMHGAGARQQLRLEAAPGALLDHDGGVTILQHGCDYEQSVEIVAHPGASVWHSEIVALGRLARGERLAFARYAPALRVLRPDGTPRFEERADLRPGEQGDLIDAAVGGAGAIGSLVIAGPTLPSLTLPDVPGVYCGATALPSEAGLLVRALSDRVDAIETLFDHIRRNIMEVM